MIYQDFLQTIQHISQLIQERRHNEAIEALYQMLLSDISEIDKADCCVNLAVVYDQMGDTDEAIAWYEKGISYEQTYCRYEVTEKKAHYLSQLGHSNQAVPLYESLLTQPYITESEKDRMRKTVQSFLGIAIRGWK
jgi:tetratricopeptide (TPR) repeat protein